MSEGTLQPSADVIQTSNFDVEYAEGITTAQKRVSTKLSDFPRVATLRSLFASVKVLSIHAEVRQDTMLSSSDGFLSAYGHVYVAIIPTNKDTDSASGATRQIVSNVPNKQTFSLSETTQMNSVFQFNLNGYELDLAQDPRRGAGPVAWLGNSGIIRNGTGEHLNICTVTWRLTVACSGATPLWQ
ncbi:hypothetical protein 2 [Solanum melongena bastro-like virus]|uniref:ORF2 n=1 Tax=Plasmopara viticola lesion associated alpha-like virus 1 TaxID=2692080 RepID=A0A6B9Q4X3_9VIRU|nr:ORF2 [Plasmopara viticola lesion associated alpha-like virus 1]QKI28859.1 hypothetical protein 2 [Solanum melongena bastro-like virus]